DVGIAIDILGVGYVNAPFEYHANNPSGNTKYNCNRIEPLSISSGAKAIVYFYIKKTFAGKLIIPETKIVTLYGTISRDTPVDYWICPYISRHLLSLNPLLACCRRYSRGER
ncbi:hypothetical protein P7M30_24270, partial [Vibrio parahaemolyticus]|nr:hypothetical protein [Vibrio parahaemolyticus]